MKSFSRSAGIAIFSLSMIALFAFVGIYAYSIISLKLRNLSESSRNSLIKEQSVKIYVEEVGSGSGVIIKSSENSTYVLTNKHVCNMAAKVSLESLMSQVVENEYKPLKILTFDGKENIGIPIKVGLTTDLCLLKFNSDMIYPSASLGQPANLGDVALTSGFPLGSEFHFSEGIVGPRTITFNARTRNISIMTYPGSSGSGVFNKKGELIGLINAGSRGAPSISIMVDSEEISDFLEGIF